MNVTLPIPDEFATRFGSAAELGRRALEALVLAEFRAGRLTRPELGRVLGFSTPGEADGFLEAHGMAASVAPAEQEVGDLVARFRAFSADKTLGGIGVGELVREGRR